MQSGQQLASQLLQELRSAGGAANGASGRFQTAALQHTAMTAAEGRMRSLSLEVYWQRFGGSADGVQHSAWAVSADNSTAASGAQLIRAGPANSSSADHASGGSDSGIGTGSGSQGGGGSRGVMSSGGNGCANLYGVLRSPRGDGKEGLVLATPVALAASVDRRPGAGWRLLAIQCAVWYIMQNILIWELARDTTCC